MVVEDDIQSQQYMDILLSRKYDVLIAANAHRAWETLKSRRIDLILMDISLQGEVDGLQLTRAIRASEDYGSIPIIALTAHAFPADRQKSLDAGCTDYLSKPFQRDELLHLLDSFLA